MSENVQNLNKTMEKFYVPSRGDITFLSLHSQTIKLGTHCSYYEQNYNREQFQL